MNISAGEKLANILESHGLRKVNIPGDGHCLFKSLSHQLYNSQFEHDIVRERILRWLSLNSEVEEVRILVDSQNYISVDDHVHQLSLDRSIWGDHLDVKGCASAYDCNINVFTPYGKEIVSPLNCPTNNDLNIVFDGRSHFDSTTKYEGATNMLNTSEATDEIPHYLHLNKDNFLSLTNQRDFLLNHIQDARTKLSSSRNNNEVLSEKLLDSLNGSYHQLKLVYDNLLDIVPLPNDITTTQASLEYSALVVQSEQLPLDTHSCHNQSQVVEQGQPGSLHERTGSGVPFTPEGPRQNLVSYVSLSELSALQAIKVISKYNSTFAAKLNKEEVRKLSLYKERGKSLVRSWQSLVQRISVESKNKNSCIFATTTNLGASSNPTSISIDVTKVRSPENTIIRERYSEELEDQEEVSIMLQDSAVSSAPNSLPMLEASPCSGSEAAGPMETEETSSSPQSLMNSLSTCSSIDVLEAQPVIQTRRSERVKLLPKRKYTDWYYIEGDEVYDRTRGRSSRRTL
ncbi:hypothetical protein E3Q18_01447 [Wallemia mellicola]|uniref:OTU domain-containing protein n=2 Tax=Wallemia mellicola TaxID=1708541 RepID=A0A4T0NQI1_9BASI|nr:hypothetical protein E3Q19_01397 [Wallemia mellicola]TIB99574.1 hypothetical protein E3Q18_01447 [Wallemia mellicola]TIC29576.1 hypothetical protein E3Q11_01312 [Wallemia mellicola]TIC31749.1 hypothetical protein E3Q10_01490 [Wallemia mellicola]